MEIKFRVWDGKSIVYESYNLGYGEYASFYIGLGGDLYLYEDDDGGKSGIWEHGAGDTNNCILMQYTGLKDKNGKEIYEGDILMVHDAPYNMASMKNTKVKVEPMIYYIQGMETYLPAQPNNWDRCSVIGNIYENPEILEKAEEVGE